MTGIIGRPACPERGFHMAQVAREGGTASMGDAFCYTTGRHDD